MVYIIAAVLGGIGLGLVLAAVFWLSRQQPELPESFLAPVLAADALDSDLRVLYARSMVLDAIESSTWGSRVGLGPEVRRVLVTLQSLRVQGAADEEISPILERVAEIASSDAEMGRMQWEAGKFELRELRNGVRAQSYTVRESGRSIAS